MDRLARLNGDMLPFAKLLGIRFVTAELDRVVAEMLVRDELCTRPALAHGGAVMAITDTLGAAGTILNLPAGDGCPSNRERARASFRSLVSSPWPGFRRPPSGPG